MTCVPSGSRVLACEHVDPEHLGGLRIMQLVPPTSIVASPAARARDTAARSFECGWVFLCEDCWREAVALGIAAVVVVLALISARPSPPS